MAWQARKNRNTAFKARYYKGKIIGFKYSDVDEINYVLPEFRGVEKIYE